MSKNDDLRAMREARYAANQARARAAGGPAARPRPPVAPARDSAPPEAPAAAGEDLCGHRNMGGRTCTRERGHDAKSHRYS